MKYARLTTDGLVIETFVPHNGFTIEQCFIPDIVREFQPVPDYVEANWQYKLDGTFEAPKVDEIEQVIDDQTQGQEVI